jgi:hypothetical protein
VTPVLSLLIVRTGYLQTQVLPQVHHQPGADRTLVDAAFSEYEAGVESLGELGDGAKNAYLRKLGFAIDSVAEGYGANTKWKWSFVELEGRYAVVAKNLLNLKSFLAQQDPRVEGYAERQAHMALARRLLQQSADRYREKYELSTQRLDDIKQATLFLSALRRLHVLLGEVERPRSSSARSTSGRSRWMTISASRSDRRLAKFRKAP